MATNTDTKAAAADAPAVLSGDQAKAAIATFLESSPLYSPLRIALADAAWIGDLAPRAISLHCRSCTDQVTTTWTPYGGNLGSDSITFRCARCESTIIEFWIRVEPHPYVQASHGNTRARFTKHVIRKVGQWPAWHDRISPDIERVLEANELDLYKKASASCANTPSTLLTRPRGGSS